jgi:hypothetical protein
MTALAGVSLALTALAAQVSPPNVRTVDAAAPAGGTKPAERVAIKLPAATLDRYAGTYKLNAHMYIDVRRDGDAIKARGTGQPEMEIFPESETSFFWKPVDAQLIFANDGSGTATLHQWGNDMPLTKVDPSESAQAQAVLDARFAAQTPQPGTEAALRHTIDAMQKGHVDYEDMEPMLAGASKQQEPQLLQTMQAVGPVKSITFKGVGQQGWDAYDVQFAHASLNYYITLADNGKIEGLLAMGHP